MNEQPKITELTNGGKGFVWDFEDFKTCVYVPKTELNVEVFNYGFRAPYLLYFAEKDMDLAEAVEAAEKNGLAKVASSFGASVVTICNKAGSWKNAPKDIYEKVIAQSRISQYYKDGIAIMWNRFEKKWEDYFLRGTVSRAFVYGKGEAGDYLAENCLKELQGQGMFGPGDITPVCVTLENISVVPAPSKRDIPVVTIGNSEEVNKALKAGLDHVYVKETAEHEKDFKAFTGTWRRMVGNLEPERDYEKLGLVEEPGTVVVETSTDNKGDDKDTKEHTIGYIAFYNQGLFEDGKKVPLVLCFHGGGDSIMFMCHCSGWPLVANKHNFLLVCIEEHMNSTASEMMDLLDHLKEQYPIDEGKIYASGFSMGGCKSWDLFQEYPTVFAGVAPMDATFEVGYNVFGNPVEEINEDVIVPVFYAGGEDTPLPELPFQADKCTDRMRYTLQINQAKNPYDVDFEHQEKWENPIFGVNGDKVYKIADPTRGSVLTLNLFESENGCCYDIFGCVSKQQHEVRHHTCENAYLFLENFRRLEDGSIEGGKMEDICRIYESQKL